MKNNIDFMRYSNFQMLVTAQWTPNYENISVPGYEPGIAAAVTDFYIVAKSKSVKDELENTIQDAIASYLSRSRGAIFEKNHKKYGVDCFRLDFYIETCADDARQVKMALKNKINNILSKYVG